MIAAGSLRALELIVGAPSAERPLPLVVVLHGLGDAPSAEWLSLLALRTPARVVIPRAPKPYQGGFSWFDYRMRDRDPERLAVEIAAAGELVAGAIEALRTSRPTRGRAIVTGFSQGGMLSYALALRHPELIELAVPISGALPPRLWPERGPLGARVPAIRALHGSADEVVPYADDRALSEQLQRLGYDAQLATFDGVAHHISPAMRAQVANAIAPVAAALASEN